MSRRRPGSQPQRDLHHPNDPSIFVTVRKPKSTESSKLKTILAANRRAIVVYDRDGNPAKDEDNNDRTYIEQAWPIEAVIEWLRIHVVAWGGINDEYDAPLALTLTGDEPTVAELAEHWLNVTEEAVAVQCAHVCSEHPAPAVKTRAYSSWLMREVAKPETFTKDPTAQLSATL